MHRLALLTCAATLALIFAGGLVTSTGSGLAVPDWPLSYGQLMPPMVGGVLYEHGHRMIAAGVGALMLALACWIFWRERRRWVGWVAACALAAVVLQGVLGGITVLLLLPPAVSIAHACLAQVFLCLTVVLAAATGPSWDAAAARRGSSDPPTVNLAIATTATVYLQVALGAVVRHTGAGLAIPDFPLSLGRLVPPLDTPAVAIHFAHRLGGVAVALVGLAAAWRVLARHRAEPLLARPALLVAILIPIQIGLGGMTVLTGRSVVPTTAHVACGAGLLAASLVLALRARRMIHADPVGRTAWATAS